MACVARQILEASEANARAKIMNSEIVQLMNY